MSHLLQFRFIQMVLIVGGISQIATAIAQETSTLEVAKDGAWARYHVKYTDYDGSQSSHKFTMSSVGCRVDNGRKCRWIEVKHEHYDDPVVNRRTDILKFLIPEAELASAEKPLLHVVKVCFTDRDGKKIGTDELPTRDSNERLNINWGPTMVFFPGPLKNAKRLEEPKTVDYQRGRLVCETGLTGRHVSGFRTKPIESDLTWTTDYSLWLHKDVPFGFAAATMKTTKAALDDNGKFLFGTPQSKTAEYFLEDMGTDAKSALQDSD